MAKFFIDRPVFAWVIAIIIMLAGGMALRALLAPLDLTEVPTVGDEHRDVDTWEDLRDLS